MVCNILNCCFFVFSGCCVYQIMAQFTFQVLFTDGLFKLVGVPYFALFCLVHELDFVFIKESFAKTEFTILSLHALNAMLCITQAFTTSMQFSDSACHLLYIIMFPAF